MIAVPQDYVTGDAVYMPCVTLGALGQAVGNHPTSLAFTVYKNGDFTNGAVSPGGISILNSLSGIENVPVSIKITATEANGYVALNEAAHYTVIVTAGSVNTGTGEVSLIGLIVGTFWLNRTSSHKHLINSLFQVQSDYVFADSLSQSAVRETAIGSGQATGAIVNVYHARVVADFETGAAPGTGDRYTAIWHKNGVPVTAGITSPTILVLDTVGNTILSAAMEEIPNAQMPGVMRYTSTEDKIPTGSKAVVEVGATIDSLVHKFRDIITNPD